MKIKLLFIDAVAGYPPEVRILILNKWNTYEEAMRMDQKTAIELYHGLHRLFVDKPISPARKTNLRKANKKRVSS